MMRHKDRLLILCDYSHNEEETMFAIDNVIKWFKVSKPLEVLDYYGVRTIIPQTKSGVKIRVVPMLTVPNAYQIGNAVILVYQITDFTGVVQPLILPKTLTKIYKEVLSKINGRLPSPFVVLNDRTISLKEGIELEASLNRVDDNEDKEAEEILTRITFFFPVGRKGMDEERLAQISKSVRSRLIQSFKIEKKQARTAKEFNPLGTISAIFPERDVLAFTPTEYASLIMEDGMPKILQNGSTFMGFCPHSGRKVYKSPFTSNGITVITGKPGTGKSVLARNLSENVSEGLLILDPGGVEKDGSGGWRSDPNLIQFMITENEVIDPFTLPYKSDAARRGMFETLFKLLGFQFNFGNAEVLAKLEYILLESRPNTIYEFRECLNNPAVHDEMLEPIIKRLDMLLKPVLGDKSLYVFTPLVAKIGEKYIPFEVSREGRPPKNYIDLSGSQVKGVNVAILLKYLVLSMTPDKEAPSQIISLIFEEFARFAENVRSGMFPPEVIEKVIDESLDDFTKDSRKRGVQVILTFHTFKEIELNLHVAQWVKRTYHLAGNTIDYDEFAPNVPEGLKKYLKMTDRDKHFAVVTVTGLDPKLVLVVLNRSQALITRNEFKEIRDKPDSAFIIEGPATALHRSQGYELYVPSMGTARLPVNVWKADPFEEVEISFARHVLCVFPEIKLVGNDVFQIKGAKRITGMTLNGANPEIQHVRNSSDLFYFGKRDDPMIEGQVKADIFSLLDFLKEEGLPMDRLVEVYPVLQPYVYEPENVAGQKEVKSDELRL